jgi:hypothetical protein
MKLAHESTADLLASLADAPEGDGPVPLRRERGRKAWSKESNPQSVRPFVPSWAADPSSLPKRPPGRP